MHQKKKKKGRKLSNVMFLPSRSFSGKRLFCLAALFAGSLLVIEDSSSRPFLDRMSISNVVGFEVEREIID